MSVQYRILGNQVHISHMQAAAKAGRLPHAYILNGSAGAGKRTFADYMAAALLCEKGPDEGPCGICPSCIKAQTHNHPDIIRTAHEKKTVLSVQEIREQLVDTVSVAPYYGPYKIYIVEDAQLLNEHGQNALLKTIEEPPDYVLIFILTENADTFLDTVRSRCIRLDMEALSRGQIEEELLSRGVSPGEARECAAFARGNLGLALALSEGGAMRTLKDETLKTLKNLENLDAFELFKQSSDLDDRETGAKVLEIMLKWYRDILLAKTGASGGFYFENDKAVIRRQAKQLSFEGLGRITECIEEARVRIRAGVKPLAVFETLFLKIREEYKQ